ncbi:hypothetical protein [Stenotrophomonas rhizophila]
MTGVPLAYGPRLTEHGLERHAGQRNHGDRLAGNSLRLSAALLAVLGLLALRRWRQRAECRRA